MKTFIRTAIILSFLTLIFTGCNKYEDGPKFSLLTKKQRLTGSWKISKVLFNGNDITSSFISAVGDYVLDIQKDGKYKKTGNSPDEGTWKFGEDKDDVYFQSNQAGAVEDSEYILRLKNKELWLRHTETNGEYTDIHYVPA